MAQPLVSVVVPAFNAGAFLGEALDSIVDQAFDPLEILVVDDGSTDETGALATGLRARHPALRLIVHPGNRGPAAARNTGLAASRGELITFLDADDLMAPGRLQFQVRYLAGRGDVDVVVGTERLLVRPGLEVPPALRWRPAGRARYCQMSMMARRRAFDCAGPFDETFRLSDDTEWMYRARAAGVRTALVAKELLIRRIHGANLSFRTTGIRRANGRALLQAARQRIRDRQDR